MDNSPLRQLPDELLQAIVVHLSANATLAFGATCKQSLKIAYENLIWRAHCVETWKYWEPSHNLKEKLNDPAPQTQWRHIFMERRKTDKEAMETFEALLKTQQHRIQRVEAITEKGYDVKDLFLRIKDETPEEAEDVLARRYYADAVLGQIHRRTALDKWTRLQKRQMVSLEEVLGSYDLFVLEGRKGDLGDIDQELHRIADAVRDSDAEFETRSIRQKAVLIAEYLRLHSLVGNTNDDEYHALRNNFISIALFEDPHTSLPLQSVAIYCSVARRLGINAKPSNYPSHVHAVIEAPPNLSLDGAEKIQLQDPEPEIMHMDPWRSSEEVPREQLTLRLTQMGAPATQHRSHLGATGTFELAIRTGRNIMHSVQEARDRYRQHATNPNRSTPYPDIEAAWYSMLWSMMILGDTNSASTLHRRRQCLPYLAEHFQQHFPEDLGLVENVIAPMFAGEREHTVLMHMITTNRAGDANPKAPCRRTAEKNVEFKIGQQFQHKRYGYDGIITGWDAQCSAEPRWIHQMRIDELPRGREQPFYNVV